MRMASEDRERWNARHGAPSSGQDEPSGALVELARWLPARGQALDVAGGAGANAVWLARRGLDVTIVDVSEVGLAQASRRAAAAAVELLALQADLEHEGLPSGPWALVLCSHYLQRELVGRAAEVLVPGGTFVWIHPTTINLERHASPSARFLLSPGEARALVEAAGLRPRLCEESWVGEGEAARHLARVVAQRPGATT